MSLYPEGTAPLPMDDVQRAANKANVLARQTLGQNGAYCNDGGYTTGEYCAIQCLTDCTFDFLDTTQGSGPNSPFDYIVANGTILPAGTIIYGSFTYISNTLGTWIAYKA